MEVMKVSTKSNPNAVAGAIAGSVRDNGAVELLTIGASALNQAVKAIAIARILLAPSEVDLICRPAFAVITVDGQERTAIRQLVEPRDPLPGRLSEEAAAAVA
jgi:stage V sporulation protein S